MSGTPTQAQMFYQAARNAAIVDQDFLFLVENGLTRTELAKCIARRPSLWSRFESWLDKLPDDSGAQALEVAVEGLAPETCASFGDALAKVAGTPVGSNDVRPWIRTNSRAISTSFLMIGGKACPSP